MQDVVRFLVIGLACMVAGSVLVVARLHFVVWRRLPATQGILPLHVWLVSVGHLCFVVGVALATIESLDTDLFSWRFYLYLAGSVFTLASLIAVAIHVRSRR